MGLLSCINRSLEGSQMWLNALNIYTHNADRLIYTNALYNLTLIITLNYDLWHYIFWVVKVTKLLFCQRWSELNCSKSNQPLDGGKHCCTHTHTHTEFTYSQ